MQDCELRIPKVTDHLTSRFFKSSDFNDRQFVFEMPQQWWSRKYEYHWASQFCEPDAVALDAACGIEHPLKFYLNDHCQKCYACDLDPRLLIADEIRATATTGFGLSDPAEFPNRYVEDVRYDLASLSALPYETAMFDRIFCVSVLEHLKDRLNRWPVLSKLGPLTNLMRRDIRDSLAEFKRVLKPGGLIVLTFDFPRINLDYLQTVVRELGLRFAGDTDFSLPQDAIHYQDKGLNCFRALLTTSESAELKLRAAA